MKKFYLLLIFYLVYHPVTFPQSMQGTKENKPWTYWWWMGSAVTNKGITQQLEAFQKAGIGGVHIIPIYGAKGEESKFLSFLSPQWLSAYTHTVNEAARLGMGVDLTTGTGWPFGGPWVNKEDAIKYFEIKKFNVNPSEPVSKNLHELFPDSKIAAVSAVDEKNDALDITSDVKEDGMLNWASDKKYEVYVLFYKNVSFAVKRAAPGGEGPVMDVFSKQATEHYLNVFDSAFKANQAPSPRSFYNDSYEVYGANWTPRFFEEFKKRRGYDFHRYFHLLADTTHSDLSKRAWSDYHETISDLLLEEYTQTWAAWSHAHHAIVRDQAHGSPGNLLDLYSAADIPETESFGSSNFKIPGLRVDTGYSIKQFGRPNPLLFKFATSAAHVSGKKYASSETCTWLADHFQVSMSQVKPQVDELFVAGINHIFFHGMTYSEFDKPFPGNLFYASTNFGPSSHFWNDINQLTNYITLVQHELQNSDPANDFLVYFPIYDLWTSSGGAQKVRMLTVHEGLNWVESIPFGKTVHQLYDAGYCFDYISDRQLQQITLDNMSNILLGKSKYKALVIPSCVNMPLKTLKKLELLALKGSIVIFIGDIPGRSPGILDAVRKEKEMKAIGAHLKKLQLAYVSSDVEKSLNYVGIYPETMAKQGLQFIRKHKANNTLYFISNLSDKFSEGEIEITEKPAALIFTQLASGRKGTIPFTKTDKSTKVYIQLAPGESCFLESSSTPVTLPELKWLIRDIGEKEITGKWSIAFDGGGKNIKTKKLESWTELGGKEARSFSGTGKYTIEFDLPDYSSEAVYSLDLGDVRESAKVHLNGRFIGNAWCIPFRLYVPDGLLKTKGNKLEIDVTNLSINRIIEMDKENVDWKKYYDINFVNIKYQPYDAKTYKPAPSGLLGPVKLYRLKIR